MIRTFVLTAALWITSTAMGEERTWTDVSGKFKTRAEFSSLEIAKQFKISVEELDKIWVKVLSFQIK